MSTLGKKRVRGRRVPIAVKHSDRTRYHVGLYEPGYSPAELEWFRALCRRGLAGQHSPDPADVLAAARSLGYRRVAEPAEEYRHLV